MLFLLQVTLDGWGRPRHANFFESSFPGVAASILFWLLDRSLLHLGDHARVIGMLVALAVISGASLILMRRGEGLRRSVASRRRIGGNASDRFDDVTIRRADDVEFLSGNKIEGTSDVQVGRLDIE